MAPAVSLGTLFLAAQLADLLWPNFVLLGFERVEIAPGVTAVTPLDFVSYPRSLIRDQGHGQENPRQKARARGGVSL